MSQNRDAPAYQEYAASMMAKMDYRTMSLSERGLLFTMRNECWVNSLLPSDHPQLAKALGFTVQEIAASLPRIMPFFKLDGHNILCPELEDYRAHLADRKERQSNGGKRSAEARNGKRKTAAKCTSVDDASTLPSTLPSTLQAPRQGSGKVLVQSSAEKPSQNQPSGKDLPDGKDGVENGVHSEWLADYDKGCTANAYARASEG